MTSIPTSAPEPHNPGTRTPREQFLQSYEREHGITMKVLHAYPSDKAELRPHPKLKTARELAWVFVLERGLGKAGFANAFASGQVGGKPPEAPDSWDAVLHALEQAHADFRDTFNALSDDQLMEPIKFFGGPKTLVDVPRIDFAHFLIADQIHHRGQLSIYLRLADAKVPSIYGPSGDEPWF